VWARPQGDTDRVLDVPVEFVGGRVQLFVDCVVVARRGDRRVDDVGTRRGPLRCDQRRSERAGFASSVDVVGP